MGLFSFVKKQMLEVLEWKDSSKDVLVFRHPMDKREEIMNSSTLIVRESQVAVFVHKGQIADVFGPGTYKLNTENIPIITKMMSLPTGFNSRIKAEVYFINTKQFMGQKWGTQNPIMMRDADFGTIRLRGFGTFSYKVVQTFAFHGLVFSWGFLSLSTGYAKLNFKNIDLKAVLTIVLLSAIVNGTASMWQLIGAIKIPASILYPLVTGGVIIFSSIKLVSPSAIDWALAIVIVIIRSPTKTFIGIPNIKTFISGIVLDKTPSTTSAIKTAAIIGADILSAIENISPIKLPNSPITSELKVSFPSGITS